ncbi:hypothetical protein Syun_019690 [Stephania yunnanensis]|uniref:Disease resistance protein n=1 Tax=Stephania yunnanensis TaxID=152371 RepID=A0AAP0IW98_9MAGN
MDCERDTYAKRERRQVHEAAENALMELISRGMVQVEKMNSLGIVKSCRLHDVLRDFSIVKAKEDGFGEVMSSIKKSVCPRLGVHISLERDGFGEVAAYNKHARSILFMFDHESYITKMPTFNKSREEVSEVIPFVDGLTSLQCLSIRCSLDCGEKEIFSTVPLQFGGINCQQLVKLKFYGYFPARALPNPCEFPPNLTILKLDSIALEEDPMPTLEKLPNMTHLYLWSYTMVRPWSAKRKAFLGSKNYNSLEAPYLEEWIVEEGAAPHPCTI